MLIPYSWLKELIDVSLSPEELAEVLTMSGLEVEGVFNAYEDLASALVVKILSLSPHPHASKLKVCTVSDGKKKYQIVSGAPNLKEGANVILALPDTVLFSGEKVSSLQVRGIKSEGVLCSPYDLGVNEDQSSLLTLERAPLGLKAIEVLNLYEPVLEVAVTPNRGDCLSIWGIAREIAAITDASLKPIDIPPLPQGEDIYRQIQVKIEVPELCYRYTGRIIKGVQVASSPFYIQKRLWMCGLRPINNVVDITNYVLLLIGQPLHAFDFDLLHGRQIIVRQAREGEKILTLDGEERILSSETMVIADSNHPIAIAGVMGGEETGVSEKTQNIFLESAWFNPSSIRITSQRLRLSSESSYRFERGVDPEGVLWGLNLATHLIKELGRGEVVSGIIDEYPRPYQKTSIKLNPKRVQVYLNIELSPEKIQSFLSKVQVTTNLQDNYINCVPPSFRHDLKIEEDLIEEIARLYGYEKLPSTIPIASLKGIKPEKIEIFSKKAKDLFLALSFYEVINYSFISPRFLELLEIPKDDPRRKVIPLANPLSEEQSIMRTTLVPGLLQTAQINFFREVPDLRIFELGRVFFSKESASLPEERLYLSGLWMGITNRDNCYDPPRKVDFFDLKGVLDSFFSHLGLDIIYKTNISEPFITPGLGVKILAQQRKIGFLGEIRPTILEKYDLRPPVFVFELDFENLVEMVQEEKHYRPLPRFPATSRDLTMIINEDIPVQEILSFINSLEVPYLEKVSVRNVYVGKPIPRGKRSLSLRFIYRAQDRTLRDKEVNELQENLAQKILKHFKAQAR